MPERDLIRRRIIQRAMIGELERLIIWIRLILINSEITSIKQILFSGGGLHGQSKSLLKKCLSEYLSKSSGPPDFHWMRPVALCMRTFEAIFEKGFLLQRVLSSQEDLLKERLIYDLEYAPIPVCLHEIWLIIDRRGCAQIRSGLLPIRDKFETLKVPKSSSKF